MSSTHQPLPFHKQFVAGGAAGIIEILAMYPTDVLKTRAQLSHTRLSMLDCCRGIVKNEGWGTFYRGITSPILAEAPKRAIKFSSNEVYKTWFRNRDTLHLSSTGAAAAGALAGATESITNCPFEVIKVRMQAPGSSTLYANFLDCARKVIKTDGLFRGLYKGFEAQVWRNGTWNMVYFGTIGTVRNIAPARKGASEKEKVVQNLITGSTAGALASVANTPFDVVKSRIQSGQMSGTWAWPALATIGRSEGIRALYRGLAPKLIRLGPGGGIMIVAFDKVSDLIR